MKVLILGSKGMLGSMCLTYLKKQNVDVTTFNKRFKREEYKQYISQIEEVAPDLIINCIGKIPQKNSVVEDYFNANVALPKALSELNPSILLVQASTDCVFAINNIKNSRSSLFTTASDDYGLSKAIGDELISNRQNSYILRASIIGTTKNNDSSGLLDWLIRNQGGTVNGFTNHYWNGITTLAWISFVYNHFIISHKYKSLNSVTHIGSSEHVSKYRLLSLTNDIFGLNIDINKDGSDGTSNRCLVVDIDLGDIETQLKELSDEQL